MAAGSRTVYSSYLYGLPNTAKNDLTFTVDSSKPLTLYLHNNSHSYFISLKSVFGLLCMNNYTVDVQVGPPVSVSRYLHRSPWYRCVTNASQFYYVYVQIFLYTFPTRILKLAVQTQEKDTKLQYFTCNGLSAN